MCDPAHRPAVASGSDHPPARANDVLLPLGHAHSLRTLGGVGKCDHAATKLKIFNVWVLLKKKKFAGPSASCQTLSSRSTLASPPRGLCTALPLPATAFPSGPSGPQSSLSHGTALSVLCPPRPALSHSPCRLALCPSAVCLLSGQARSPRAGTLLLSVLRPSISLLVERMHQEGGVSPALHVAQPRM